MHLQRMLQLEGVRQIHQRIGHTTYIEHKHHSSANVSIALNKKKTGM